MNNLRGFQLAATEADREYFFFWAPPHSTRPLYHQGRRRHVFAALFRVNVFRSYGRKPGRPLRAGRAFCRTAAPPGPDEEEAY